MQNLLAGVLKFIGWILLDLMNVFQMLIGFFPITVPLILVVVFCWRYAPKPLLAMHVLALIPTFLGLFFLIWDAWWHDKIAVAQVCWQGTVMGILLWLTILFIIVFILVFRKDFLFWIPILLLQLWFTYICFAVSSMSFTKTWL